jgi:hypothetical protein
MQTTASSVKVVYSPGKIRVISFVRPAAHQGVALFKKGFG